MSASVFIKAKATTTPQNAPTTYASGVARAKRDRRPAPTLRESENGKVVLVVPVARLADDILVAPLFGVASFLKRAPGGIGRPSDGPLRRRPTATQLLVDTPAQMLSRYLHLGIFGDGEARAGFAGVILMWFKASASAKRETIYPPSRPAGRIEAVDGRRRRRGHDVQGRRLNVGLTYEILPLITPIDPDYPQSFTSELCIIIFSSHRLELRVLGCHAFLSCQLNIEYLLGESASKSLSSCCGDLTDPGESLTGACGEERVDPAAPACPPPPDPEQDAAAPCDVVIVISPFDVASLQIHSCYTSRFTTTDLGRDNCQGSSYVERLQYRILSLCVCSNCIYEMLSVIVLALNKLVTIPRYKCILPSFSYRILKPNVGIGGGPRERHKMSRSSLNAACISDVVVALLTTVVSNDNDNDSDDIVWVDGLMCRPKRGAGGLT
ncbi:hypothetical protein EVAR_62451_1 [Eumeta japonica]|uniref:Uncharacterized protein n=1 Tax=Eumeta variegata TaxID=151549 RepID=A0A4C1Z2A5_EUMVA|nr:hypothetical protein EVAR_62451_1 [Eumeta japonica]